MSFESLFSNKSIILISKLDYVTILNLQMSVNNEKIQKSKQRPKPRWMEQNCQHNPTR